MEELRRAKELLYFKQFNDRKDSIVSLPTHR